MANSSNADYSVECKLVDGLEHITYTPAQCLHDTPLLFQHGMWHGAWCWQQWQERLAAKGWKSHAISLPGHAGSPAQGSVRFSTMGKYLKHLTSVIDSLPQKPVLIGHSMGGALAQWYLKKVADDLPAMVLVASWTSHSTWADGMLLHLKRDPWGLLQVGLTYSSSPLIRNAEQAASMLISEGALYSPDQLHKKLCEESALVLNQHNPPFWKPKPNPKTPILWLAAEKDAVISLKGARKSAAFYRADFLSIPDAAHNLMMEHNQAQTADKVGAWLVSQGL